MLDQVRKLGLFMVLAHQRFGQVDENLVETVLTNCGIKVVFGGLSVPKEPHSPATSSQMRGRPSCNAIYQPILFAL